MHIIVYIVVCTLLNCLVDATVCQSKHNTVARWPIRSYVEFSFSCVRFEQMMMNACLLQLQVGFLLMKNWLTGRLCYGCQLNGPLCLGGSSRCRDNRALLAVVEEGNIVCATGCQNFNKFNTIFLIETTILVARRLPNQNTVHFCDSSPHP